MQFLVAYLVSNSLYNMIINIKKGMLLGSKEYQHSLEVLKSTEQTDMLNLHNTRVITQLMGNMKPRANIK